MKAVVASEPAPGTAEGAAVSGSGSAPSRVAVLVPCFNEATTIGQVVEGFRSSLPAATIYVYDNNSEDGTGAVAVAAGATVRSVPLQGKGHVVRRMFCDVEADVYVLVDGDATYDASAAGRLVGILLEGGYDLVNGARVEDDASAFRAGHTLGNQILAGLVRWIFRRPSGDMLSGYKVFSRRFVKSFPSLARGFEIETELTIHALDLDMPMTEVALPYGTRPEGSASKLRTYSDGVRVLRTIANLVRSERPLAFFAAVASLFTLVSVVLSVPLISTFLRTHTVPRFPTAILVTGLMVLAFLCVTSGLILDTVTRGRREAKLLRYLAVPGPLSIDEPRPTGTD